MYVCTVVLQELIDLGHVHCYPTDEVKYLEQLLHTATECSNVIIDLVFGVTDSGDSACSLPTGTPRKSRDDKAVTLAATELEGRGHKLACNGSDSLEAGSGTNSTRNSPYKLRSPRVLRSKNGLASAGRRSSQTSGEKSCRASSPRDNENEHPELDGPYFSKVGQKNCWCVCVCVVFVNFLHDSTYSIFLYDSLFS